MDITMTFCGSMPFFPKLYCPISLYDVACLVFRCCQFFLHVFSIAEILYKFDDRVKF